MSLASPECPFCGKLKATDEEHRANEVALPDRCWWIEWQDCAEAHLDLCNNLREENTRLCYALRSFAVYTAGPQIRGHCLLCGIRWEYEQPEQHAQFCLLAEKRRER
jgi:hypothetical protein